MEVIVSGAAMQQTNVHIAPVGQLIVVRVGGEPNSSVPSEAFIT